MFKIRGTLDRANVLVIAVTLVLFTVALFVKGITHDLLLEAAVFLVSVKLILASYQNKKLNEEVLSKLEAIQEKIGK